MPTNQNNIERTRSFIRLAIILLAFPFCLVYVIPTFETVRQFYAGNRSFWFDFWAMAVALEWMTLVVVVATYRHKRASLEAIGFPLNLSRRAKVITFSVVLATVGLAVIGAGGPQSFLRQLPIGLQMFIPPSDLWARLFWVLVSLTAAICEETLWRGIAITELRSRTGSTIFAVLLSSFSFVFFHGGFQQGIFIFAYRLVIAFVLSAIYLRTGNLLAVIAIHFLMDASALAAIQMD
jgi:membrane protease YdiL (CAAX protease family)